MRRGKTVHFYEIAMGAGDDPGRQAHQRPPQDAAEDDAHDPGIGDGVLYRHPQVGAGNAEEAEDKRQGKAFIAARASNQEPLEHIEAHDEDEGDGEDAELSRR